MDQLLITIIGRGFLTDLYLNLGYRKLQMTFNMVPTINLNNLNRTSANLISKLNLSVWQTSHIALITTGGVVLISTAYLRMAPLILNGAL